ncbi:MAG TPA: hypothetical protein VMZ29_03660 [Candidatus Bathyarchaeia archaeon]|nr:hypothetical protein [Candidatus Bathyarchaeia archaeon]
MRRQKVLLPIMLFFFIFASLPITIQGAVEKKPLYSCVSELPQIDGFLNQTEWNNAIPIKVKMYSLSDYSSTIEIEIMSLHNSTMICFGATVPDKNISTDDALIFYFKTNTNNELVTTFVDGYFNLNSNNDCKLIRAFYNYSSDCFTLGSYDTVTEDINYDGTNDGLGKSHYDGTYVTFECIYPLDSGDIIGHDFKLEENNSIEFFLLYLNDLANPEHSLVKYAQIRILDGDFDYQILYLSCPRRLPVSLTSIFTGLVIIPLINIIRKKKK